MSSGVASCLITDKQVSVATSALHREPLRTSNIINRKLHSTSNIKRRTNKTRTQQQTAEEKAKEKLKIEPINKSNAKRIINNNWFENYGATVLCISGAGVKRRR